MIRNLYLSKRIFTGLIVVLTMISVLSGALFAPVKLRSALDYDGDGKADLAVFRSSDSNTYVLRSGTNSFSGTGFGVSDTDAVAPLPAITTATAKPTSPSGAKPTRLFTF